MLRVEADTPVSVSEMGARFGLPKATVHRICVFLERKGFVQRELDVAERQFQKSRRRLREMEAEADRFADEKGRDAFAFEPLESPYLTVGDDLRVRTPYSRTIVEALRSLVRIPSVTPKYPGLDVTPYNGGETRCNQRTTLVRRLYYQRAEREAADDPVPSRKVSTVRRSVPG